MHRTLRAAVNDLAAAGQLVRIDTEIDARLEAAQIQRRVYAAGGPAVYFARVKGCRFPMVANLFGTIERLRYLFRDTLEGVQQLVALKVDPPSALRHPWRLRKAAAAAWHMRPRFVRSGPVLDHTAQIHDLPQLVSWPRDGGPFITLPEVYTEDPDRPGWRHSNLGMYRVQLAGNRYEPDREIGLHYQIHRGIGVHHAAAIRRGEPLRVNIFVGGPPALAVAAVMPLPEGLSELAFAGALAGHRLPLVAQPGRPALVAEADFCITGIVDPERLFPEGPFGDHLGYYSLAHDFPMLRVEQVYHRPGAIWPFTTVGRPPQEDTTFGQFIHELTGPVVPTLIPGVRAVHAVDAAGVHPLLLAIGSERYVPYAAERRPMELLTQANAILGQGQMSLAKYLFIAAGDDDRTLNINDIAGFLRHVLERVDWRRDLHFQTCTTIDTLDYSGTGLNEGSKVVIAAAGPKCRELPTTMDTDLRLPEGFTAPRLALPGVLCITARAFGDSLCAAYTATDAINAFPLIILCDDSEFTARTLNNFVWVTFTRSNPAADIAGIEAFTEHKHWGCRGSLVIDARTKPHHAPPLEEDPEVTMRVDALAARGGPLHGII
ncbi:MAG TPA: UbiD family decarboxylase [Pirellulales bacterium]|jgi:4-hydroxy-3-polyprenylbenzoate decarboxylase|nr:UbiD family decarboxylase [Pirellulales bacterium]